MAWGIQGDLSSLAWLLGLLRVCCAAFPAWLVLSLTCHLLTFHPPHVTFSLRSPLFRSGEKPRRRKGARRGSSGGGGDPTRREASLTRADTPSPFWSRGYASTASMGQGSGASQRRWCLAPGPVVPLSRHPCCIHCRCIPGLGARGHAEPEDQADPGSQEFSPSSPVSWIPGRPTFAESEASGSEDWGSEEGIFCPDSSHRGVISRRRCRVATPQQCFRVPAELPPPGRQRCPHPRILDPGRAPTW